MSILWLIPFAAVAALPLYALIKHQDAKGRAAYEARVIAGKAGDLKRLAEASAVVEILRDVYTKLRKGGVSVHDPWISACIERVENGGTCPADVAALAIQKTRDGLPGGRYNVAYLDDAVKKLSNM